MTDLKCTVENCVYNKEKLCSKGDIMVGGKHACCDNETCCESFLPRKGSSNSYSNCTCHPTSNISIDCEAAKCTYNDNYKCTAEHVDIQGCGACDCRRRFAPPSRRRKPGIPAPAAYPGGVPPVFTYFCIILLTGQIMSGILL